MIILYIVVYCIISTTLSLQLKNIERRNCLSHESISSQFINLEAAISLYTI